MNELEEILGITFPKGIKISHATNDSKKVKKDSIFFGLQGTQAHGSKYINEALKLGASIVVHDDPKYKADNNKNIFYLEGLEEIDFYEFLDQLYFYKNNEPKRDHGMGIVTISGITGTNGKTTTAMLCHQIVQIEKGSDSIYIGTLGASYNNGEFFTSFSRNTTPNIFEFFEIITFFENKHKFFNHGDGKNIHIFLEVSSHALDQNRLKNVPFDNAAILNIEHDHIDYHKDLESYVDAKFKIRQQNITRVFYREDNWPTVFVNIDSPEVYKKIETIINNEQHLKPKWDYHDECFNTVSNNESKRADFKYEILNSNSKETEVKFSLGNHSVIKFKTNLFLDFNITNLIFAILLTRYSLILFHREDLSTTNGFDEVLLPDKTREQIKGDQFQVVKYDAYWNFHLKEVAFELDFENHQDNFALNLKMPKGRSELLDKLKDNVPVNIIIDYAHNPDAFETFLSSTKDYFKNLITVFGCGGNRDKLKRPDMLKKAIKYSSQVVFTSDNSRDEEFKEILKDASEGNNLDNVIAIEERKEAIIYASKLLKDKDCLVILGKGHEVTQEINGKISHFSDHEVINEIYN
jgi:UDP-N-acetylmuramyl tripeptide synthase